MSSQKERNLIWLESELSHLPGMLICNLMKNGFQPMVDRTNESLLM
jgi:hypothetical protein